MSKLLKILGRSVSISAEWILIVILFSVFAIRSHMVQTFLGEKVTNYLSDELNAELSIGAIEFVFFDEVYLKDISIIDPKGQRLLSLKELKVEMDQFAFFQSDLVLNSVFLNEGEIDINRRLEDGQYNYQFILDYFSTENPKRSTKNIFEIKKVTFSNINFRYDDKRHKSIDHGVDFNHLFLNDLSIDLSGLFIGDKLITAKIADLHFKEQSGFILEHFKSELRITDKQIGLSGLIIESENSKIHSPLFELNYKSWSSFDSFNKSVAFNSFIDSSLVSMADIAYFAPSLKGMKDVITVQGQVINSIDDLEVLGLELAFGNKSLLKGDFQLPDFSVPVERAFTQFIKSAFIDLSDLQAFELPEGMPELNLEAVLDNKFLSVSNLKLTGDFENIDISASFFKTDYGKIQIPAPMRFHRDSLGISIEPIDFSNENPFLIEEFALGSFLKQDILGSLKGSFTPSLSISKEGDLALNFRQGALDRFDINGYSVSGISIDSTSIKDNVLDLVLSVNDKNLDMYIRAEIDLTSRTYKGEAKINRINLDALNYTSDSSVLAAAFTFDLDGATEIDWGGNISCSGLSYYRGFDTLTAPYVDINISSNQGEYTYELVSDFFDAKISGDFDWEALFQNFYNDLAVIFPTLKVGDKRDDGALLIRENNVVSFEVVSKMTDSFFNFFIPGLYLDSLSKIQGTYNAFSKDLDLVLSSDEIQFGDLKVNSLYGEQSLHNDSIFADYILDFVSFKDSLKFNLIEFYTDGTEGTLSSQLSWEPGTDQFSKVNWNTTIHDKDHIDILLQPSFFSLDSYRWEIVNESDFSITTEDIHIEQFELSRGEQNIKINGCLSENDFDKLYLALRYVDVSEISSILGLERSLEGVLSGWSVFSNPYENFHYIGDLTLKAFHVANELIGDVFLRTGWDNLKNAVNMRGELNVDSQETFSILGSYFTKSQELDLNLLFENTDISFLNALMDPEVIKNISGNLDGTLSVDGPWHHPELKGSLLLDDVRAKVELLGVDYFLDGEIEVQKDLFALNNIPLKDMYGNTGSLVGSFFHKNFKEWSYDVQINFEDDITKQHTTFPYQYEPLNRFLLLDTKYKDGDSYFGKAYGRGNANISGYGDNMMITVNVTTQDDTEINFPMYGSSEIDEDFEFVNFKSDVNIEAIIADKFDFSGLDLDLNFNLTPQAKLNIIFDPSSGDQILARGFGAINMKLNPFYEVDLNGTYTISDGSTYNFAMGLIKQDFAIEKGSTISWTGDPYNADIELVTSFSLQKVSLKDLAPELVLSDQESKQMKNQNVVCYLNLDETLLAPQISFDIDAPNAPETGKALLNEVLSEESELSKQFFSLLLLRSFQPLNSSIEAHASAAMDLAESQVNALLGDVSEEYDLNFSSVVGKDLVGLNLIEFGISRRFFNDRLILSGSFGLEEDSTGNSDEASYIPVGDLFVEYLINESGTFRATAFREADTYNAGNNESGQKAYNHGAGISYQEDFTNVKDFKLLQYFFDIFRPKDKRRFLLKKKRKLTKIDS
ncbi:MAG: translocation/assembly module TamB domain-containing protein [Crocinitomicaceae bacterium]|tara:strand:- start:24371 stop:28924 length:4554 start_codon:yes stop_codon:yes gene_type:complete